MKRAVGLLAVALVGCGEIGPSCQDLGSDLAFCDVRPRQLACDELSADDRSALEAKIRDEGCGAVWTDDRVDPRFCEAFGWECPEPLRTTDAPLASTRHPVVFVGGIDAREEFDWSPRVLEAVAARTGSEVHHVGLAPWSPVETRAEDLAAAIDRIVGTTDLRVNLVCYAIAGLDCRYLVSPGGLFADDPAAQQRIARIVASITTLGTAHRGTDVATAALRAIESERGSALLDATLGGAYGDRTPDDVVRRTLRGLGNEAALAFNRVVVDAPGVDYQSFAAVSHVLGQPFVPSEDSIRRHCVDREGNLRLVHDIGVRDTMSELLLPSAPFASRIVTEGGATELGPSDGMIAVDSAKWGEFRGCVPADHYDLIGQFDDGGPDPETGFDAARFAVELVSDLARRGR